MKNVIRDFKQWWKADFEKNREFFEGPVDPFDNFWGVEGEGLSSWWLSCALAAGYADAPVTIMCKFALAAVAYVDRALAENKFEQGKLAQSAFPRNRAVALRARAYAKVLLGEALPTDDLLQASRDFETRAMTTWNHQYEAYFLNGVRAALIAEDPERFIALLGVRREFRWHAEEYGVLRGIADELADGSSELSSGLKDRFRSFFDRYRDPQFKPDVYIELDMVRFELGAIWCRVFSKAQEINWRDVISVVSD